MTDNAKVVLGLLDALENRRLDALGSYYHPELTFHWPPGLSYSGDHQGRDVVAMSDAFRDVWGPLQPDEATRRMDPRVVAAEGDMVVVHYIWRGKSPNGVAFETPTSAHYQLRDGKLFDARMFYYDLPGLIRFLDDARR